MRISKLISLGAALVFTGAAAFADAAPRRIVSMNLCTDQLAMLLSDPDRIVSLSYLATDPRSSAMHREAQVFARNQGQAEEIYLQEPDLVLAGQYTGVATVNMLKRLGKRVEVFLPAYSLEDVRDGILHMGQVLGHQARAEALVAQFDADLAALREDVQNRPLAALYYANGYTTGDKTLAGQILLAAGFDNAITRAGQSRAGNLPLELLVMLQPDAVVTGAKYPGQSRSEAILDHPVIRTLQKGRETGTVADSDWLCGTPYVLRAIADLVALRHRVEESQ
ncbi:ABC transporter substrate-binding protein [Thalassobius vesicularis]|uniref:ABC transporter substrate-binding protein n=1 Tax=Thalassobius vesicularis TaxID=1294297 RepID=UPI001FE40D19|nr:ABC transporter substrate-binding protein [Thalassobius vesicularis]